MLRGCGKWCSPGAHRFRDLVLSESQERSEALKRLKSKIIVTTVKICLCIFFCH